MQHTIKFYPVGDGDTSQIILDNGQRILFDYRHCSQSENEDCPKINLEENLKEELTRAKRDYFDIVAFTHCDTDHIQNSTNFFELTYSKQYQGNGRIKIKTLWVPAAMIVETTSYDHLGDEFIMWRKEARYRLIDGKGIRVFSKPNQLKDWLAGQGISLESRQHLITDAGSLAPEFDLYGDGVEFFCHSPFIKYVEEREDLRNDASLIFNVRFLTGLNKYDYLAIGDTSSSVLEDIVHITKYHKNDDRLEWDILNIPHHCSYKALNEDEKGSTITEPMPLVKELLLKGRDEAYMVSSSRPIDETAKAYEQTQPPHIQAKKCYVKYLQAISGCRFLVTMEEPNRNSPKPIEFVLSEDGIKILRNIASAPSVLTSKKIPRAGEND